MMCECWLGAKASSLPSAAKGEKSQREWAMQCSYMIALSNQSQTMFCGAYSRISDTVLWRNLWNGFDTISLFVSPWAYVNVIKEGHFNSFWREHVRWICNASYSRDLAYSFLMLASILTIVSHVLPKDWSNDKDKILPLTVSNCGRFTLKSGLLLFMKWTETKRETERRAQCLNAKICKR